MFNFLSSRETKSLQADTEIWGHILIVFYQTAPLNWIHVSFHRFHYTCSSLPVYIIIISNKTDSVKRANISCVLPGAHYPELPSVLYPWVNPVPYLSIFRSTTWAPGFAKKWTVPLVTTRGSFCGKRKASLVFIWRPLELFCFLSSILRNFCSGTCRSCPTPRVVYWISCVTFIKIIYQDTSFRFLIDSSTVFGAMLVVGQTRLNLQ